MEKAEIRRNYEGAKNKKVRGREETAQQLLSSLSLSQSPPFPQFGATGTYPVPAFEPPFCDQNPSARSMMATVTELYFFIRHGFKRHPWLLSHGHPLKLESPTAEWNCAEHYRKCDSCPMSQSDPDIAGIGPRKLIVNTSSTTAKVYAWVGETVTKIIGTKHAVRCAKICYDMIICLGDQQLVGSVGLLVATIKKLHFDKTLSAYHFQLVLCMVSLSSTAFTFSMICYCLRHQRIEDDGCTRRRQPQQQHGPRPWCRRLTEGLPWAIRMFFWLSLKALLLYNISVAARMKDLPWDCPAICYKNSRGIKIPLGKIDSAAYLFQTPLYAKVALTYSMASLLFFGSRKLIYFALYLWTHIHVPESLRRLEEITKEEMQIGFGQTMAVILLVLLAFQLAISIS
ncbi:hypothetical protein GE21DRAFT_128, partial [Neurospora crassa]